MRPKLRHYKKENCKKKEQEVLRLIKKYAKYSTYRRFAIAYKEKSKIKNSICIPLRVKKRQDKNKQFIRAVAKMSRILYGGCGNDTQTLINVMELAFKKGDYAMIGPIAELLEPDEDDVETIMLMNRLLNSRSNLTEFNIPEGKKRQKEEEKME